MRGWFPVVLNRGVMRCAYVGKTTVGCCHYISEHSSHIQVFWKHEDVAEILNCCSMHRNRHFWLGNLFQHKLKDVFHVLQGQWVSQNLSKKNLGHITKDNSMLAHQSFKQELIDLIVWRPVVTNYMVCNGFNKLGFQVVMHSFLLQIRVSKGTQTLGVIDLHVGVVRS